MVTSLGIVHAILGPSMHGTSVRELDWREQHPCLRCPSMDEQCMKPMGDFGQPFVKRFALCCLTIVYPVCLSVLWPYGWMHEDGTWYGGRPWPRPHCIRWGPRFPPKWSQPPPQVAHLSNCWAVVAKLGSVLWPCWLLTGKASGL